GHLTTEALIFLGQTVLNCWQQYVTLHATPEATVTLAKLLLSGALAAMYNAVDPMVRLISGASYVDVSVIRSNPPTPTPASQPGQSPGPDLVPVSASADATCNTIDLYADVMNETPAPT